jgi:DNA polymerase-3 subunit gamma/tau
MANADPTNVGTAGAGAARREAATPPVRPPAEADEFDADDDGAARFLDDQGPRDVADYYDEDTPAPAASGIADPHSFAAVVALAAQHREARLTLHLEEHVSLVRFDRVAGAIDLFLLPGAPAEIANELREKLNRWTGRRWVVMLSKAKGELPLGEVKRARAAAEIEALKSHPAVKAVLDAFPNATIEDVRRIARENGDDSATG